MLPYHVFIKYNETDEELLATFASRYDAVQYRLHCAQGDTLGYEFTVWDDDNGGFI